jgi:hypothetical protein
VEREGYLRGNVVDAKLQKVREVKRGGIKSFCFDGYCECDRWTDDNNMTERFASAAPELN